jgi:hypothetical protein
MKESHDDHRFDPPFSLFFPCYFPDTGIALASHHQT